VTVQLDPKVVPPGYLPILSQNRAFPIERIIDVQGQLHGGTIIYLEGGREAKVTADINDVLRAIDEATWRDGIELAEGAPPTPQETLEQAVRVVAPKQEWLDHWSNLDWLWADVASSPGVACRAVPNLGVLSRMAEGGITGTTSCIYPSNHARGEHLTVVVRDGVTFEDKQPTVYTVMGSDVSHVAVRA